MTNKEKYQTLYPGAWCGWSQLEPPSRQYAIYIGQRGEDARQVSKPCRDMDAAWKSALDALKGAE